MGLWDNIMALEFIQDNIVAFGGDPSRVTVFGQSSGGSNIGALQSAPQAAGTGLESLKRVIIKIGWKIYVLYFNI